MHCSVQRVSCRSKIKTCGNVGFPNRDQNQVDDIRRVSVV